MWNFILKNILFWVVFLTGFAILVVEVIATRILAPYFGNTIFTFSSVIGVILLALSIGYYVGGRLSDEHPSAKWLYSLITLGGFSVLILQLQTFFLLPNIAPNFSIVSGPLFSSLLLFLLPAMILGTLSPYAIKLQHVFYPQEGLGKVSGLVFFWSTLGSIFGSLTAGFVLIPKLGLQTILISISCFLILLGSAGCLVYFRKKLLFAIGVLILMSIYAVTWYRLRPQPDPEILYQHDGIYSQITVLEGKTPLQERIRILKLDKGYHSAIDLNTKQLLIPYTQYYSLYQLFQPQVQRALFIGGGAYTMPAQLLKEVPEAQVDVAEIDTELFKIAQKFFFVEADSRLHNHIEDGRHFLQKRPQKYDYIFLDAFSSFGSMPMHMTTQEFFLLVRERLNPQGIFIANILGGFSDKTEPILFSLLKTIGSVFPHYHVFATQDPRLKSAQNFIVIASPTQKLDFSSLDLQKFNEPVLKNLAQHHITQLPKSFSNYLLLKDDFSPIEYYFSELLHDLTPH